MLCTIKSCLHKVAANGNHYLDIVAQPADPWSEPLNYRLFGSAERCDALAQTPPKAIDLRKVSATVKPYNWVNSDGTVGVTNNTLSVTCRFAGDCSCDDAGKLAAKYQQYLLEEGKIALAETDDFGGLSANED